MKNLSLPFLMLFSLLLLCTEASAGNDTYQRQDTPFREYNATELIGFTVAEGSGEDAVSYEVKQRKVDEIKSEIEKRLDMGNIDNIRREAAALVAGSPGGTNIAQICSIYNYARNDWSYISDPHGMEYFQYANLTLDIGKKARPARSGVGDCDDFSILMSSFIESIGGATMIVMARDPAGKGGHVYAEVYLGKVNQDDKNIVRIIEWLRRTYDRPDIAYDIPDPRTGEVWLNLDWNTTYPGGPPEKKAENMPLILRSEVSRSPMQPANEPPQAFFSYSQRAMQLYRGAPISFNASLSRDVDNNIKDYMWHWGDDSTSSGIEVDHTYAQGGIYQVVLTVNDSKGAQGINITTLKVNEPPKALFSFSPENPQPGDRITFRAVKKEDISEYKWDFGDEYSARGPIAYHEYMKRGPHKATFLVRDDKGGENHTSSNIIVGLPVINMFSNLACASSRYSQTYDLSWNVSGASRVEIQPDVGEVTADEGSTSVSPKKTTVYTLKAENEWGTVERELDLAVSGEQPVINSFLADPERIDEGESTTLRWNTSFTGRAGISSLGWIAGSRGSVAVSPKEITTYTLGVLGLCSMGSGEKRNVTVTVGPLPPSIFNFSANPEVINAGQSTTLFWGTSKATSVFIEPGVGKVSKNGQKKVTPTKTTVYILTGVNEDGNTTETVEVKVL
ncbi:MAG: PKD domain-containing protein [Methanothrix sp.]|nr:PKD domain-containing protein [Methanothrix sp.]